MSFIIRKAVVEDCKRILELIQELADYEKYPDGPKLDEETFIEDGFGERQFYRCFVATCDSEKGEVSPIIVGYCLYFFTYSTWEGRTLYMEDLYVTPSYRQRGIGTGLWKRAAKEAVENKCDRLDFSVLNWNKSAIDFYRKIGAKDLTRTEQWHKFRLHKEELKSFASSLS